MKSKQVVPSLNLAPGGAHPSPRADRKLKSERVQLDLQLPARVQRMVREATGGKYSVGEVVTVGLDLTPHPESPALPKSSSGGSMGGSGAIVEAGPAPGTPGHNPQPSTSRKEEDHARI